MFRSRYHAHEQKCCTLFFSFAAIADEHSTVQYSTPRDERWRDGGVPETGTETGTGVHGAEGNGGEHSEPVPRLNEQ